MGDIAYNTDTLPTSTRLSGAYWYFENCDDTTLLSVKTLNFAKFWILKCEDEYWLEQILLIMNDS